MRKYLLIFVAVLAAGMARADDVVANASIVVETDDNITETESLGLTDVMREAIDEAMAVPSLYEQKDPFADVTSLETPASAGRLPVGTYRNWLGEECLKFDEQSKNYYNWKRDVTYTGLPIFLASFLIKREKKAFRSARFAMDENWKSKIDDYLQFSPYVVVVGLKAFGYQGRSSWDRLMTSALLSNGVMALIVNATKYSVKEMRPDNSTANSFPSGHTATAFAAATVLHKEYGLTRSPWFSVGGYTVAIGTGFMRVLNNRHWISDVIAGAGIGIISTEIGYFLGDLIFRNKGITHLELDQYTKPNHPSFFTIELGIATHKSSMKAEWDDGSEPSNFQLGTSSVVGVEGAYFINKYIGFGGIARVTTTPVKGIGLTGDEKAIFKDINQRLEATPYNMPGIYNINATNSHMIDASFDAGIYGNLPLSRRFSLGAKFLCGVRVSGGFEYKATMGYRQQAKDASGNTLMTYNGKDFEPLYVFEHADRSTFISNEALLPGVMSEYNFHLDDSKYKSEEYSLAKVTGRSNINYVFGVSLNYKYKANFAWRLFLDYDSSKNHYTWKYNTVSEKVYNDLRQNFTSQDQQSVIASLVSDNEGGHIQSRFKSRFNLFTIGAGFTVNF